MDDADAQWFTSSFSGGSGNGCVEVAFLLPRCGAAVRDTKDRALPAHTYRARAWDGLLARVRAGELTRR